MRESKRPMAEAPADHAADERAGGGGHARPGPHAMIHREVAYHLVNNFGEFLRCLREDCGITIDSNTVFLHLAAAIEGLSGPQKIYWYKTVWTFKVYGRQGRVRRLNKRWMRTHGFTPEREWEVFMLDEASDGQGRRLNRCAKAAGKSWASPRS